MAIVKVKYTRSLRKVKAHVRYITHRPTKEGARHARPLFNKDGQIDKSEAYRFVDQTIKGARFYKLIVSPDPKTEDTTGTLDLWRLTRQTIDALSKRLGKQIAFIGVEHNDHSVNRHVHLIFTHTGRLTRQDIRALREAATIASGGQLRERQQFAKQIAKRPLQTAVPSPRPKRPRTILRRSSTTTLFCSTCQGFTTQVPLRGEKFFCQSCHKVRDQQVSIGATLEAGWER